MRDIDVKSILCLFTDKGIAQYNWIDYGRVVDYENADRTRKSIKACITDIEIINVFDLFFTVDWYILKMNRKRYR